MAGHGDNQHGAMDISAHQDSYSRFMKWAFRGTIICFVLGAVAVLVIAS
jgi:hypothetical protein